MTSAVCLFYKLRPFRESTRSLCTADATRHMFGSVGLSLKLSGSKLLRLHFVCCWVVVKNLSHDREREREEEESSVGAAAVKSSLPEREQATSVCITATAPSACMMR